MLNKYIYSYINIIIMGDINCDIDDNIEKNSLINFCGTYSIRNMVTEPTSFKNPMKPTNIDVILKNRKEDFTKTTLIETGISDDHILRTFTKNVFYRNKKNFDANVFRNELLLIRDEDISYDNIKDMMVSKLDIYVPIKKRLVRGNRDPYMNAL